MQVLYNKIEQEEEEIEMEDSETVELVERTSKRGTVSSDLVSMRCRMAHLCLDYYLPILEMISVEQNVASWTYLQPQVFEDDYDFLAPSYKLMDQILKYHSRHLREKDKFKKFVYTQGERNYDSKFKKYRKTEQRKLESTTCLDVTGKDAMNLFSAAVNQGQKQSCVRGEFCEYIYHKELFNLRTWNLYSTTWFRKRQLQLYSNKKRGEDQMINRFKKKFGEPNKVLIGYGDWNDSAFRSKGFVPTIKGKAMRKLFRKAGFKIFLVDEYRTSKCCSKCAKDGIFGENTHNHGITCPDPNIHRKKKRKKKWLKWYCKKNSMDFQEEWRKAEEEFEKRAEVKPWGLLKCKYCTTMWDRDFNSGINIMEIMKAKLAGYPGQLFSAEANLNK
ncbi:hypothetical protein GEMRC1_007298 [Eukaryota sp. GEM-RC1]